ncbi:MAG: hypothetical protein OEY38_14825 [Gammaproteobacteria bacterium]|nr:hypothetical protein [Gammaproteobacteria bacterium]
MAEHRFFSLQELSDRWNYTEEHIIRFAESGKIVLSFRDPISGCILHIPHNEVYQLKYGQIEKLIGITKVRDNVASVLPWPDLYLNGPVNRNDVFITEEEFNKWDKVLGRLSLESLPHVRLRYGTESVLARDIPRMVSAAVYPDCYPRLKNLSKRDAQTGILAELDKSDWDFLIKTIWYDTLALAIGSDSDSFKDYLDIFNKHPSRPDWELVPYFETPQELISLKESLEEEVVTIMFKMASEGDIKMVSSFTSSYLWSPNINDYKTSYIGLEDFAKIGHYFDVRVSDVESEHSEENLRKHKQDNGWYSIEDASAILARNGNGSVDDIETRIVSAIVNGELSAYPSPGSFRKTVISKKEITAYTDELYWSEINEWLAMYEPHVEYRFYGPYDLSCDETQIDSEKKVCSLSDIKVEIEFLDYDQPQYLRIIYNGIIKRYSFCEMGFCKKNNPSEFKKPFYTLLAMAKNSGVIHSEKGAKLNNENRNHDQLGSDIKRLRDLLVNMFSKLGVNVPVKAISDYDGNLKGWKTEFKLAIVDCASKVERKIDAQLRAEYPEIFD